MRAVKGLLAETGLSPLGTDESAGTFFVAEEEGRVIGTIGLECFGNSGLLRSAAVAMSARSRGVGQLLVDAVISHSRAAGLSEIVLLTTTADEWFRRFGFLVAKRSSLQVGLLQSSQLQGGCPSSAVIMRLPLSAA